MGITELSYLFAFGIGLVVSLDVAGLLISQHEDFSISDKSVLLTSFTTAALHALTHSALFLAYFFLVTFGIEIPHEFVAWLQKALSGILPEVELSEVMRTTSLLSSIIIVLFVWVTYAQKIAENHRDKFSPTNNHIENFRLDIRVIFKLASSIRNRFKKKRQLRFLLNFALALAVAVDMLAITSFIRVFFSIAPDAANLDGQVAKSIYHLDFGHGANADPWIFALTIFVSVLFWSCIAILVSRSISDRRNQILGVARIMEPLLVFWVLVVALDHLFGNQVNGVSEVLQKLGFGFVVAVVLTSLLVYLHGWEKIKKRIEEGANVSISKKINIAEAIEVTGVTKAALIALCVLFVTLLLIVFVFFLSHRPGIQPGDGLERFLGVLSAVCALLALAVLFLPFRWISRIEFVFATYMSSDAESLWNRGDRAILCSLIAYFVLVSYISLSFSGIGTSDANFSIPLYYLGLIATFTWIFLTSRRARARFFPGSGRYRVERRRFFCTTLSDILTAFALVVFGWQALRMIA